jgi:hypothetical protein
MIRVKLWIVLFRNVKMLKISGPEVQPDINNAVDIIKLFRNY